MGRGGGKGRGAGRRSRDRAQRLPRADATSFKLSAEVGSETYGICSNKFLDEAFKTIRYELTVRCDGDRLTYSEDTQLKVKGRSEIFHHTDGNTLKRIE